MYELPKKVKIIAHEYTIEQVEKGDFEHGLEFGHISPRELKIYIDASLPVSRQKRTLIHEIIHALDDQYNIFNGIDGEKKEQAIKRLSSGLLNVLESNQLVFHDAING